MPQFTVCTYNIHYGVDRSKKYNLEATCAVLSASDADIIGLSEVDRKWGERSNWDDQLDILSKRLEMAGAFAASIEKEPSADHDVGSEYGNALLSRYRITDFGVEHLYINNDQNISYDGTTETEPRSILQAEVDVKGEKIMVLCTHLSVRSQAERLRQVGKLEEIIKSLRGPLVLVGDLNADPASEELAILRKHLEDPSEGRGFITKPDEDRQIDYILIRDLKAINIDVIKSEASDHYPILAKLALG